MLCHDPEHLAACRERSLQVRRAQSELVQQLAARTLTIEQLIQLAVEGNRAAAAMKIGRALRARLGQQRAELACRYANIDPNIRIRNLNGPQRDRIIEHGR